ncbi:MAG: hypothetical protein K8U03_19325 [Planctomycetia bacterium]|nr:hypothetical protein [Planctomycetia bacterium]
MIFVRTRDNDVVREVNDTIAAAIQSSLRTQAKTREVQLLMAAEKFKSNRAELTSTARQATKLSADTAALFRRAAEQSLAIVESHDVPAARTYYRMKRESLLKKAEIAEASRDGYTIAADESIAELHVMFDKMEPFALKAKSASAEAKRLTAEADSYRDEHRAEF